MNAPVRILAFAGSTRQDSVNALLINVAADTAQRAGAQVTNIDLADYPAAIYNGDDEAANGLPETMRALQRLIATHDALLIATPEYNGFMPPLLVNVLSWTSRPDPVTGLAAVFRGKPAAIMAASPGGLGGVRVIPRMRACLAELGCVTIPGYVTLPGANNAFDAHGKLHSGVAAQQVHDLVLRLIDAGARNRPAPAPAAARATMTACA